LWRVEGSSAGLVKPGLLAAELKEVTA